MSERSPLVSSRSGTSSSSGYGGADEYEPSDDENVTNDIPGAYLKKTYP